jgi:tRNA pseudouridine13 synthase
MLFQFKQSPADFIVDEQIGDMERSEDGSVRYIRRQKEDQNTMDIIAHLTKHTPLTRRQIGVAGLKDKKALTTQRITIERRDVERVGAERITDILSECVTIIESHRGDRMLGVGRLLGNQFTIRLRATDTITDYVKVQIES